MVGTDDDAEQVHMISAVEYLGMVTPALTDDTPFYPTTQTQTASSVRKQKTATTKANREKLHKNLLMRTSFKDAPDVQMWLPLGNFPECTGILSKVVERLHKQQRLQRRDMYLYVRELTGLLKKEIQLRKAAKSRRRRLSKKKQKQQEEPACGDVVEHPVPTLAPALAPAPAAAPVTPGR